MTPPPSTFFPCASLSLASGSSGSSRAWSLCLLDILSALGLLARVSRTSHSPESRTSPRGCLFHRCPQINPLLPESSLGLLVSPSLTLHAYKHTHTHTHRDTHTHSLVLFEPDLSRLYYPSVPSTFPDLFLHSERGTRFPLCYLPSI